MDGLVGYGSDDSENSKNSPALKNEEKRHATSSAQLEAEWESFQKLIGEEKDTTGNPNDAGVTKESRREQSSSEEESDKESGRRKRRRKKSRQSGSSSSDESDKSGKSDSGSDSSDASSNEESDEEKKEKEGSPAAVSASKSPEESQDIAGKKRSRSPSSSSESETETKVELGQTAEEANGQPDSGEKIKERRPSHRSSSPRHRSRERRRRRRSRSRSPGRRRRKRRPRRSRSRGRRSRSHGRRHRKSSKSPERRVSTSEKGPENQAIGKSGDRLRSRSRSPKKNRRRSSRSPRRRKRSGSRSRRHRRSRSPPLRRRRRRRKRRPSRRVSRSRTRSRSKSPVVHKKRNEPLNYKEQLKQSLLQVQKQAAEGKLNLEELTAKGKDLLTPNEKPSALPLGSENPLVAMATGQLGQVTPQQALLQTMAAMHQKAQELTGVAVPKYYNPASVNPLKYAEQVQKRKLLWSKNKEKKEEVKPSAVQPKTQWDGASFSQDQDGKQAEKFRKLMGIKKQDGSGASTSTAEGGQDMEDATVMRKQQELFSRLDQEYEFARMATHTHRGVGLGFSSLHQYPNK